MERLNQPTQPQVEHQKLVLDHAPFGVGSVLEDLWRFATEDPVMTDAERGALVQLVYRYLASQPDVIFSGTDLLDESMASEELDYTTQRGLRYHALEGNIVPTLTVPVGKGEYEKRFYSKQKVAKFKQNDTRHKGWRKHQKA